jgi:hypothetical protein
VRLLKGSSAFVRRGVHTFPIGQKQLRSFDRIELHVWHVTAANLRTAGRDASSFTSLPRSLAISRAARERIVNCRALFRARARQRNTIRVRYLCAGFLSRRRNHARQRRTRLPAAFLFRVLSRRRRRLRSLASSLCARARATEREKSNGHKLPGA